MDEINVAKGITLSRVTGFNMVIDGNKIFLSDDEAMNMYKYLRNYLNSIPVTKLNDEEVVLEKSEVYFDDTNKQG